MSRLYDTIEPSVIDDEMLHKAVEEQGPKEEAGRIAKQEGIDFADVLALRLDYKNILKIDNLWCFTALTKLQLDNNIIEKIEGLNHLVNLVWLGKWYVVYKYNLLAISFFEAPVGILHFWVWMESKKIRLLVLV